MTRRNLLKLIPACVAAPFGLWWATRAKKAEPKWAGEVPKPCEMRGRDLCPVCQVGWPEVRIESFTLNGRETRYTPALSIEEWNMRTGLEFCRLEVA